MQRKMTWLVGWLLAWGSAAVGGEALPTLTVVPERAVPSGTVRVRGRLASGLKTCQVIVRDAYRTTEFFRVSRPVVAGKDGSVEVSLSYRADPGMYAVYLADSSGQLLAGPGHFFVPGITKRGPWWLFAGQPMCGAIRTWGQVTGEHEKLIQPIYKGGWGFNVVTLEIHHVMLGRADGKARAKNWPVLERNAAYGFALPMELGWGGLSGPFAVEKMYNEKGVAGGTGGFHSTKNLDAVTDYLRRLRGVQFPSGKVSPSFLGLCAFENHLGFKPWYDYSPTALAAYRSAMRGRYGQIEAYNKAWGTSWASWEALDAPRDAKATRHDWVPWTDFRFSMVAGFYGRLQGRLRSVFPGTVLLPIVGGMLGTMQNDSWVSGMNAFMGCDERIVAANADVISTEGWADYVAGHSDLLLAAADPNYTGRAGKPIWTDYYTYLSVGPDVGRSVTLKRVDQIAHGATGTFLEHVGAVYELARKDPKYLDQFRRAVEVNRFLAANASLLIGSRVETNVALVTPTDTLKYGRDKNMVRDADATNAGIGHALMRLHRAKRWVYQDAFSAGLVSKYPAALATMGKLVGGRFVEEAGKYVRAGGKLYLEGLGDRNEFNEPAASRLDGLIGATVQAREPADDRIVLDSGGKLKVRRLATVTALRPGTEVLAKFGDGTPAVVARTVGKGLVIWAPNWIVRDASFRYIDAITKERSKPFAFWDGFDLAACAYYGDVLGRLGVSGPSVTGDGADAVRTSVLHTEGGSKLLSLVNYGPAKKVSVTFCGEGTYLRDLRSGRRVALQRKGREVRFDHALAANEWTFLALAKDEAALDADIARCPYRIRAAPSAR